MRYLRCGGLLTAVFVAFLGISVGASSAGTAINFSSLDKNQHYQVSGTLYSPENSSSPCPAIVLVHGTAGIDSRGAFYREAILNAGIAILEVDFKTGVFT